MCGWRPVTNRPWPPHEPQNGPGRLLPAWGGAGGSGRGGPAPPAGGGPRTWGVESPARTPLLTGIVDRCWVEGLLGRSWPKPGRGCRVAPASAAGRSFRVRSHTNAVTASRSATAVLGGSWTMPGPEWIWVLVVVVVLVAAVMAVLRLARRLSRPGQQGRGSQGGR